MHAAGPACAIRVVNASAEPPIVTIDDPPSLTRIPFRDSEHHWERPRMELRLTYDATTDVAYLVLAPTGPADILGPTLLLEHDPDFAGAVSDDFTVADGRLVGLEFRKASASLPAAWLAAAERIDGQHLARRIEERLERSMRAGTGSRAADRRAH